MVETHWIDQDSASISNAELENFYFKKVCIHHLSFDADVESENLFLPINTHVPARPPRSFLPGLALEANCFLTKSGTKLEDQSLPFATGGTEISQQSPSLEAWGRETLPQRRKP